ncbi:hypothetical protein [Chamaesiphon sp.]|uniref:hypothetical protein n=1 Tax=Chamaesiphon sp. TaxID=2814140 RepID=UPI003593AB4E
MTDLQIISGISKATRISEIEFLHDSGVGDDADRLAVTISQAGTVYLYRDSICIIKIGYTPLHLKRNHDDLIKVIIQYLDKW